MDGVVTWQSVVQRVIDRTTAGMHIRQIAEMTVQGRLTDDRIEVWLDGDTGEAFLIRYTWSATDRRRYSLIENDVHSPRDALALAATIAADGDAPETEVLRHGQARIVAIV